MRELFDDLDRLGAAGTSRVAIATLVATSGATPRKQGARMLVGEGGRILGSVTIGGCVDARVIEEAERSLADETARLVELTLGDEDAWATGLTCGGTVEVLVEPVRLDRPDAWPLRALSTVRSEVARGGRAAIVSRLDGAGIGLKLVVLESGQADGSLGQASLDLAARRLAGSAIATGRSQAAGVEGGRVFVEAFTPPQILVVVGATHLAMALCDLARATGFAAIVIDGRPRFATPERFPDVDLRVGIPSELVGAIPLTSSTALVLAAHDYKYDLPVLRHALTTNAGYIGLLGSRRRGRALKELLRGEGFSDEALGRIRVPIGLDLGGSTVPEIALAIVAEIVSLTRRGTLQPLSHAATTASPGR
jgi:xanthine dehydrogenase accessory factor